MDTESLQSRLEDYTSLGSLCLPVVELLATTLKKPATELTTLFNLESVAIGCIDMESGDFKKRLQLVLTQDSTYETNLLEHANELNDTQKQTMLNYAGFLIFCARVFYKRLLQEFPDEFTGFAEDLEKAGRDPSILECLGVNTEKTTLFFEEDGQQVGLIVIQD